MKFHCAVVLADAHIERPEQGRIVVDATQLGVVSALEPEPAEREREDVARIGAEGEVPHVVGHQVLQRDRLPRRHGRQVVGAAVERVRCGDGCLGIGEIGPHEVLQHVLHRLVIEGERETRRTREPREATAR